MIEPRGPFALAETRILPSWSPAAAGAPDALTQS